MARAERCSSAPMSDQAPPPSASPSTEYVVIQDNRTPGAWRVEAIDTAGEGAIYTAIFVGPDAEAHARAYAEHKRSDGRP